MYNWPSNGIKRILKQIIPLSNEDCTVHNMIDNTAKVHFCSVKESAKVLDRGKGAILLVTLSYKNHQRALT